MNGAVAKIYSEALFELASENNCSDELFEELKMLDKIWTDNPQLAKILSAPTISAADKLGIIDKAFKGRVSDMTYNFIRVLTDKNRAGCLHEIAEAYRERQYELKNIAEIKVTTSVPLTAELRKRLVEKLEKTYNKSVILKEKVDPSIMGGVVVNYGNTMLDGSVKNNLDNIGKQIKGIIA